MWEAIKNWMAESHKKEQEQYSGFTKMLSQMPNAPKANAHENIDNEIIANTLQEIAYSTSRVGGGRMLYKGQTKDDEDRYVELESSSLPTDQLRQIYYHSLLDKIKQNPQFADTTSSDLIPGLIKEMQQEESNPIKSLISTIKGLF